jgi:phosphoglycerate dehydrogenase-like enzyme
MKILIVSPVSAHAVEQLSKNHDVICAFNAPNEEIRDKIVDRDVLIFRSGPDISEEVMKCAPSLSLLIRAGSGIDNLDLGYARERGITLKRIEQPGARAVAELGFALMLGLARRIRMADQTLRQGKWAKHELTGYLLTDKTLGIYGCGNIGSQVGEMGVAWGMRVVGCVEHVSEERVGALAGRGIRLTNVDEVLSTSDFLSLNLPLNESTRNLISQQAFERMKPSAFLINLARGGIVDEQALLRALQDNRLAGAGLDVHEAEGDGKISPLAHLDNVLLTPHIGAGTVDTQYQIGEMILEIVEDFSQSELNPANL